MMNTTWLTLLLVACAAPPAPTRTVLVRGTHSDSLGQTLGSAEGGTVRVALHGGPVLRVDARVVDDAALEPGAIVAVGGEPGELRVRRVIESLDRLVLVEGGGTRELVPLHRVVAVLRAEPSLAPSPPVAVVTPPETPPVTPPVTPPPPDARRFATVAMGLELLERARLTVCDARGARVLESDGTIVSIPLADLRAPRLSAGDRVHALWQDSETTYPATVMAIEGALHSLRYDDGDSAWVRREQIVRIEATPGRAPASCPRGQQSVMIRRGALRRTVEVLSCNGTDASVRASENDAPRSVPISELRALSVPAGARVQALWHGNAPYPATAGTTTGDVVHLIYEDGSVEDGHVTHVRWIASDFVAEPYTCVPAAG